VVLYALIFGQYPFINKQRKEVTCYTDHPRLIFDNKSCSPELRSLLEQMLAIDPKDRISMSGVANHPWFKAQKLVSSFPLS
jgi:serine/threonine protein kinase